MRVGGQCAATSPSLPHSFVTAAHFDRTLCVSASSKPCGLQCPTVGAFSHSAHSANYYGDYPGNNPENHPPCGIMQNQFKTQKFKHLMLAMGPRDLNSAPYSPVHCSSHSMTSFQSSELTELPVVENSQLFAQSAHSACTAHGTPPVRPPTPPFHFEAPLLSGYWHDSSKEPPSPCLVRMCLSMCP